MIPLCGSVSRWMHPLSFEIRVDVAAQQYGEENQFFTFVTDGTPVVCRPSSDVPLSEFKIMGKTSKSNGKLGCVSIYSNFRFNSILSALRICVSQQVRFLCFVTLKRNELVM
jgi:hypothetical protein